MLCVIDIFSKCVWIVPLKDKIGITIVIAFQKVFDKSRRKANKIWVDNGSEYLALLKNGYKIMILKCIQ